MKHELDGLLCQKSLKSLVLKVFWIHPFSIIAMKIATSQIMLNPNPNFVSVNPQTRQDLGDWWLQQRRVDELQQQRSLEERRVSRDGAKGQWQRRCEELEAESQAPRDGSDMGGLKMGDAQKHPKTIGFNTKIWSNDPIVGNLHI